MRFSRVFPAAVVACLCVSATLLPAQTRVLKEISFTGAPAYSQSELLALTGLKPGGSASQEQIQAAAQRLNDTGLFDDVNFSGNDKGIIFALKPAPASAMLPVRFTNFVWWQDDEIDRALKAHVALYRADAVPVTGNIQDSITTALKAMLVEKGLPDVTVSAHLGSKAPGVPPDHIVFAIDSPAVLIHSLTLVDASPGMQPKLERVIHDVAGKQWDKDTSYVDIASRVGDVYRNDGYIDIAVSKQDHSAPNVTANDIEIDVTASLSEGAQYHVTQLAWAGSDQLSTADFNKQAALKPGAPDSPAALRESLRLLTNAYGAKGYIDAKILAPPVIDRAAHQVAYTINVVPGSQYHFKSVRFPNVSDAQEKQFDSQWQMKPGDVYDSTYIMKFLAQNSMYMKQGYKIGFSEKRDPAALTIDVTITFTKGAPPQ